MDRRDLFKFVGGIAAGALVKATEVDKPPIQTVDPPDCVQVSSGSMELIVTDEDIAKAVETGEFSVHLPPPEEGRQIMIKNMSTYHAITVVSDGATWHVT